MWKEIWEIWSMIAGIALITIPVAIIWVEVNAWVKDKIVMLRWEYKRKHRFDKPPTAKCYCKDCIHYIGKYKSCGYGHIEGHFVVNDTDFCSNALPPKYEPKDN